MQKWGFGVFLVISAAVTTGQSKVPAGSKIFIAPMDGHLDGFIAPEIIKKKLPLVVVTEEKDAEYVLTGASIKADDKWYHTIFGGKDKNEGNVRLLRITRWFGLARRGIGRSGGAACGGLESAKSRTASSKR